jgi:SOS response regulatory protein OraA/RecX
MTPEQDPLQVAVRALRHRDLPAAAVAERLERAGVSQPEREQALETLARVGYVDDERFARQRADTLAARDWGDAGIDADLERQGVSQELRAAAIAALEPETERAERAFGARGRTAKTAAYLARKGFGADALETVVADQG